MSATPGPWLITPELGCKDIGPADREDDDGIYAIAGTYGISPEADDKANAALIAAAPELLQRLKEARDAIASLPNDALGSVTDSDESGWYIKDELLHYIDVTIAKAEPAQ